MSSQAPNHPAPGKAEIVSWLAFKARGLGLPEQRRWASLRAAPGA